MKLDASERQIRFWVGRLGGQVAASRVQGGLGFRVQGSGFRVQGSGFRVWASGADGLGFRFPGQGLGFVYGRCGTLSFKRLKTRC